MVVVVVVVELWNKFSTCIKASRAVLVVRMSNRIESGIVVMIRHLALAFRCAQALRVSSLAVAGSGGVSVPS